MSQPPTLLTARLALRALTLDDVEPLHKLIAVPGVMRYFDMDCFRFAVAQQRT